MQARLSSTLDKCYGAGFIQSPVTINHQLDFTAQCRTHRLYSLKRSIDFVLALRR